MANLKDILKVLRLKRTRLEKDVVELTQHQLSVMAKIQALKSDKQSMVKWLGDVSNLGGHTNDYIVFERWSLGQEQKRKRLEEQRADMETQLKFMKVKLKSSLVQEDIISTRLKRQDIIDESVRVDAEASTYLELWVNKP